MKNLLLLTTTLAVGYLLGINRKLKNRVVTTDLQMRGDEIVAISRLHDYRSTVADDYLCRADIDALQARKDAGEELTDAELRTLYSYQKSI